MNKNIVDSLPCIVHNSGSKTSRFETSLPLKTFKVRLILSPKVHQIAFLMCYPLFKSDLYQISTSAKKKTERSPLNTSALARQEGKPYHLTY